MHSTQSTSDSSRKIAVSESEDALDLSIVMPCLNEAETLATCIRKAQKSIAESGLRGEVVIADNGSSDGSQEIAISEGARVVSVAEKGYGNALRGGIQAANGKWILMGDADDSYDFSAIVPFIEKLKAGSDLVMGCRFPRGGGKILPGAMPWSHRWLGNPGLTFLGKRFFKCPANDFYCGLRGFKKSAYEQLHLITTGMEFACEMIIKASLRKMAISEVPITLHPDGRSRSPHLRTWRDGWRTLRFMMIFSPRWLFLYPGLVLTIVCALVWLRLEAGPWKIGIFGFDINTLAVATAGLILGTQILFFALFVRTFAVSEHFLPPQKWLTRFYRRFDLERGLLIGGGLFLAGIALLFWAFFSWRAVGFGAQSYSESLRKVIPAITLIMLGVQTCFSSFVLSILNLRRTP